MWQTGSPQLPNTISHMRYWYLLPESSNSDLVCVCRGRFRQHTPILLSFHAVENALSEVIFVDLLITAHCSAAMVQEAHVTLHRTAWGHLFGGLYWITVIAVVYFPDVHRFTLGNTDISTEIYIKIKWLVCKRLYCLAAQLLQYIARALQIGLCSWTNVKQNWNTGPPTFFKLIFRAHIISRLLERSTCLPSR